MNSTEIRAYATVSGQLVIGEHTEDGKLLYCASLLLQMSEQAGRFNIIILPLQPFTGKYDVTIAESKLLYEIAIPEDIKNLYLQQVSGIIMNAAAVQKAPLRMS